MKEKNPTEIKALLDSSIQEILILDVREYWEYDICHIDGSLNVPMGQIINRLDEIEKDKTLVVVCHHGIRSRAVGQYLSNHGFLEVLNLTGGIDRWSKEIDEDMPRYV